MCYEALWCGIVNSSLNSFLYVCQITHWCPVDLVLDKPPRGKNQLALGLVIWKAMRCTVILFRSISQGIFRIRMNEQCWQNMMEPHLAGKLFHQGVGHSIQLQHITST